MGIGRSLKKAAAPFARNTVLGRLGGGGGVFKSTVEFGEREKARRKAAGLPSTATEAEVTTANLFGGLSRSQQADLLLNNPNIITPTGTQTFDPRTNTVTLGESEFTEAQRGRQEGLAAQLTGSLSGDISAEDVQKATFERGKAQLDPIFKQQRRDLEQQLADQGIPAGSERSNEALDRLEQSQGRQFVDLSQASIMTSEQARQGRFNEIASLLGTSQVQGVGFGQFQPRFSGLDLFGAEQANVNRQFQGGLVNQQLKTQEKAARLQALGAVAGAGIGAAGAFSDENLKENITKVGISEDGITIYEFEYKDKSLGAGRFRGVIAQELQEANPEAVIKDESGFLKVNYDLIDVNFEKIND
jgi:hypothetical protein